MRHVHLGLGRFHRAHQAFYLQQAGVSISAFSMRSATEADALRQAGYRYELQVLDGASRQVLSMHAIDEALFVQEHQGRLHELMCLPEVTTLTLTVTEKAYHEESPILLLLVEGLRQRQAAHSRPLHLLSCDNLMSNGRRLEGLCRAWAEGRQRPFDQRSVAFLNTVVDRVVPSGEGLSIETEPFHQWVIEDRFRGPRPAWEQPGLFFVDQVEPFEQLKLRLLNASHSFLAYAGQLRGHRFVHQAIADPELARAVRRLYFDEVGPDLAVPAPLTLEGYGEALLHRFANPALPHRLAQIAMDGSQKLPQRVLPGLATSSVLRQTVQAWFEYLWLGLSGRRDFAISDPLADRLREALKPDYAQSVAAWKALLGWPQH